MAGDFDAELQAACAEIASRWRDDRRARQARRHLESDDFASLAEAGFFRTVVEPERGGGWRGTEASIRSVATALRTLAGGDPSVALVAAMHPAVVLFWLAPSSDDPDWQTQRAAVVASARDGEQWGTITSEPGSGGDIMRTRTRAVADPSISFRLPGDTYRITGDKHFGSGSGMTSFMITTAVADGEDAPSVFVLDTGDLPWERGEGFELLAAWDGMGMAATQSHAMRLDGAPAVRMAWDAPIEEVALAAAPPVACLFTSVVVGILDEAIRVAAAQLAPRLDDLRPYERVEWSRAELEHWLAVQAYEGGLRSVEAGNPIDAFASTLRAKEAAAELAEQVLLRTTRVLGGGTFSQRSPFSHWFEDVRALGFLRPPWGLAFDQLFTVTSAAAG